MFVADEITVSAGFSVAAARLLHVVNHGALRNASSAAYEEGLTAGLRVVSKLVRVQFLPPVHRGATMTVPLRWEADGAAGDLFPVLDADLILARAGDDQVQLGLSGSYRPPFGKMGVLLDRTVMSRVGTATIRSLLDKMAEMIADPAPAPAPVAPVAPVGPLGPPRAVPWPRIRPEQA
jgi:hypothetical protein